MNRLNMPRPGLSLLIVSLLASGPLCDGWIAQPGTVKVFGGRRADVARSGAAVRILQDQLRRLGAQLIADEGREVGSGYVKTCQEHVGAWGQSFVMVLLQTCPDPFARNH